MQSKSVNIDQVLDAPVSRVWSAITEKSQLQQWFFDPDMPLSRSLALSSISGAKDTRAKLMFTGAGSQKSSPTGSCNLPGNMKVIRAAPPLLLSCSRKGIKTRLKLTHEGLETFAQDKPDFASTSFEGGWTALTGLLSKHLTMASGAGQ